MQQKKIYNIYWSATGNTQKLTTAVTAGVTAEVTSRIANRSINDSPYGFNDTKVIDLNFTKQTARETTYRFTEDDLAIMGFPTYAGKLPNKILPDIQSKLLAFNTPAIVLVTYGNRSYDNSLAELVTTLQNNGFRVAAAAAFPCRHAFSDKIAYGHPDQADLNMAEEFGQKALTKILSRRPFGPGHGRDSFTDVIVPGNAAAPYYVPKGINGQPAKFLKAKPLTDEAKCNRCGKCLEACPMGSIGMRDPEDKNKIDFSAVPGICIKCQACIRVCPEGAKYFEDAAFLSHVAMLEQNFTQPKDPEFYL